MKAGKAYIVWHDVVCLFCGEWHYSLTLEGHIDTRQKCWRCGGPLHFSGDSHRTLKPPAFSVEDLKSRRGRPPRWLLEQRKALGVPPPRTYPSRERKKAVA